MIFRVLTIALFVLSLGNVAQAQEKLVADLDQRKVQITTDFNGAELLLFGALDRASVDDIAIIVKGPSKKSLFAVKKKWLGSG